MEHDTPLMISAGRGDNASWLSPLALEHHRRPAKDRQARKMGAKWVRLLQGFGFFNREDYLGSGFGSCSVARDHSSY
jgi:hypothetical protein